MTDIVERLKYIADAMREMGWDEWPADIEAARDLLARLPVTADGVRVVPGMTLWTPALPSHTEPEKGEVLWIQMQGVNREHRCVGLDKGYGSFSCPLGLCFSTESAARAATAKEGT